MRCQKGDLAIIVKCPTTPEILGHVVEVIGPFTGPMVRENGCPEDEAVWSVGYPDGRQIQASFLDISTGRKYHVLMSYRAMRDAYLVPIRPHQDEDEMIRMVGKPGKVES